MTTDSADGSDDARQERAIERLKSLKPIRILVIDDDPIIGKIIGIYLKEIGFETAVITTFNDLTQQLDDQWPGLVITDIHLPGTDGFGVMAEIRRREADSNSRTPIIAMSSDNLVTECLNAGADGFLRKPIIADRLFATLDRMLT